MQLPWCGHSRLDGSRSLLHPFVIYTNISQSTAKRTGGSTHRGTNQRHQENALLVVTSRRALSLC